jgi:hypothetical protein
LGYRRLNSKGRTYVDLRVGVERSQIDPERGESMPRLSPLSFKFGERKLFLRDGLEQRLSARPLDGRLASVWSSLLSLILHGLSIRNGFA